MHGLHGKLLNYLENLNALKKLGQFLNPSGPKAIKIRLLKEYGLYSKNDCDVKM